MVEQQIKHVPVLDSQMAYREIGQGPPIVFLHGNPTSSYLWRNIIPHVEDLGRCLAPDLVGMGRSAGMPNNSYRFTDHIHYLDAWFEAVGATHDVILFGHDWGAALAFNRICRFSDQISGIAYMEAMVRPRKWSDLPAERNPVFKSFRTEEGANKVLDENLFVEKLLFEMGVIRDLTDEEKEEYRRPYRDRDSRKPTLLWPQEIPFDGDPADVYELVDSYSRHMQQSGIPKLFVNTTEGHGLTGPAVDYCRKWPNQTEVLVEGRHYAQEDSPEEIGRHFRDFVAKIRR